MSNFKAICESMKAHGMKLPSDREILRLMGAKQAIWTSLSYFINQQGKRPVWIPEYDRVAEWMEDNDGKGLLMYGNCGMGKTVLGMYVIPSIILALGGKVVKCYNMDEMNRNADEVKSKRFVYLDDIGTESAPSSPRSWTTPRRTGILSLRQPTSTGMVWRACTGAG